LTVDEVLDALEMAEATARSAQQVRDWQKEPLGDLIAHIKIVHHSYTRDEIVRLTALLHKVCSVHGQKHPELFEIQAKFGELGRELTTHMMKEEMVLFPYIERMEEAVIQKEPVVPGPFGTVKNPVAMMEHEHDLAGNVLRVIRKASNEYVAPDDACVSYQTLYQALSTFEADLHQHIHLENNLLFPRAVVMEKGRGESSGAE
jgi:regulator of cell morphogenesis and NO signaling